MSPALTYRPAYLGLYASLVLAAACNAFLDTQYGSFAIEVGLWAILFGLTLRLGWRQRGEVSDAGKQGLKMVLVLGLILSFLIFIPMWGFPRAGLAMLAMLQAAHNCVTVTRRHLHLGLLVSAAMVMFAASHHRADWTMLFYLLPYVMAVVFTLVAEQINRRSQDLKQQSLGQGVLGGQWAAIAAATAAILLLGGLIYSITPQLTWPYLQWRYGQMSNLGWLNQGEVRDVGTRSGGREPSQGGDSGQSDGAGNNGQGQGEGQQGQGQDGQGSGSGDMGGTEGQGYELGQGWPSPEEMRNAAKRPGMPQWQKRAIEEMAEVTELAGMTMKPILQGLDELWQSFKNWLDAHRDQIAMSLALLALLALLYALWRQLREAKAGTWLHTRFDYLRFGLLGLHARDARGIRQLYAAISRLFALHDLQRAQTANTREYLAQISRARGLLRRELIEVTRLFEDARYSKGPADAARLGRMRDLYRELYQTI